MDSKGVSEILLNIKAVVLRPDEPFTYASGIKSPIYCDNRLLWSYVEERKNVVDLFCKIIEEQGFEYDVLAGVATGGIAPCAMIAEKLGKPMIYVRSKAKGHGKENLVEGRLEKGQKVLVIEDLISTGGSSITAITGIRDQGGIVTDCVAIYTYDLPKAIARFKEAEVNLVTLTNFETTINVAKETDYLSDEQANVALAWNKDPENWGV